MERRGVLRIVGALLALAVLALVGFGLFRAGSVVGYVQGAEDSAALLSEDGEATLPWHDRFDGEFGPGDRFDREGRFDGPGGHGGFFFAPLALVGFLLFGLLRLGLLILLIAVIVRVMLGRMMRGGWQRYAEEHGMPNGPPWARGPQADAPDSATNDEGDPIA